MNAKVLPLSIHRFRTKQSIRLFGGAVICQAAIPRPDVLFVNSGWRSPLLSFLMLLAPAVALGQGTFNAEAINKPVIESRLSRESVAVAEPFQLEVQVVVEPGTRVRIPTFENLFEELQLVDSQTVEDVPSRDVSGRRVYTFRFTLESLVSGTYEVPPLDVVVMTDESEVAFQTNAHRIEVQSAWTEPVDPEQHRDIRPPVDIEPSRDDASSWIAVMVIASVGSAATIVVVGFVVRNRRRKNLLTPQQWALLELDQTEALARHSTGESETVVQQVSDRLRQFLQWEFAGVTEGRTLAEVTEHLHAAGSVNTDHAERIRVWSDRANQVRFGGSELDTAACLQLIDDAREIVRLLDQSPVSNPSRERGGG